MGIQARITASIRRPTVTLPHWIGQPAVDPMMMARKAANAWRDGRKVRWSTFGDGVIEDHSRAGTVATRDADRNCADLMYQRMVHGSAFDISGIE